jgi:hypothetical protein
MVSPVNENRNAAGHFGTGNNAASVQRGRPKNAVRAEARNAWGAVWTPERVTEIATKLLDIARGDSPQALAAAKLGLGYTLGKPGDETAERLDQLEALLADITEDAAARTGRAGIG